MLPPGPAQAPPLRGVNARRSEAFARVDPLHPGKILSGVPTGLAPWGGKPGYEDMGAALREKLAK